MLQWEILYLIKEAVWPRFSFCLQEGKLDREEMLFLVAGLPQRAVLIRLLLHQRQSGIPNPGTVFHNAWLMHCSEWCMRYFLCSLAVMQSHTLTIFLLYVQKAQGSLPRQGPHFPSCHKLTNCLKHAVQGSPFRSALKAGCNKEIFFHFKVRQIALLVKWRLSGFFWVLSLALSSWEIFPSRRYGCKNLPEVWVPLILQREMFFFSVRGSVTR